MSYAFSFDRPPPRRLNFQLSLERISEEIYISAVAHCGYYRCAVKCNKCCEHIRFLLSFILCVFVLSSYACISEYTCDPCGEQKSAADDSCSDHSFFLLCLDYASMIAATAGAPTITTITPMNSAVVICFPSFRFIVGCYAMNIP